MTYPWLRRDTKPDPSEGCSKVDWYVSAGREGAVHMAVARDHPYAQFNFLVDLGNGSDGTDAGFAEVTGLDAQVDVIEYRNGNSKVNEPIKIPALSRVSDVTLKRGVIGTLTLWEWYSQVRNGEPDSARNVTIQLLDEHREGPVMVWRLRGARPVRHVSGPLDASGTDVAIEELVLSYERLEIE
jgi:phage tail-like protein